MSLRRRSSVGATLTMNKEEAEDIAQETFTKALERIDQFEETI